MKRDKMKSSLMAIGCLLLLFLMLGIGSSSLSNRSGLHFGMFKQNASTSSPNVEPFFRSFLSVALGEKPAFVTEIRKDTVLARCRRERRALRKVQKKLSDSLDESLAAFTQLQKDFNEQQIILNKKNVMLRERADSLKINEQQLTKKQNRIVQLEVDLSKVQLSEKKCKNTLDEKDKKVGHAQKQMKQKDEAMDAMKQRLVQNMKEEVTAILGSREYSTEQVKAIIERCNQTTEYDKKKELTPLKSKLNLYLNIATKLDDARLVLSKDYNVSDIKSALAGLAKVRANSSHKRYIDEWVYLLKNYCTKYNEYVRAFKKSDNWDTEFKLARQELVNLKEDLDLRYTFIKKQIDKKMANLDYKPKAIEVNCK